MNLNTQNTPNKPNYGRLFWGPRLWYLIHKISYYLPENMPIMEQQFIMKYFSIIVYLIPCPYCSQHLQSAMNVKMFNKSLSTRQSVINWFKTQHNEINIINNGRVFTDAEVDRLYKDTPFDYKIFHELVDYFYKRVVSGQINRRIFIHWMLMTFKIFPCMTWKMYATTYFLNNDIEQNINLDDNLLKSWLDKLFAGLGMPSVSVK